MATVPIPFDSSRPRTPSRASLFARTLDRLADAFSGPMVAGIGADLFNPAVPIDGSLTPEEQDALRELDAARRESESLVREAARKSRQRLVTVLGETGSPAGPSSGGPRRNVLTRLVLAARDRFAAGFRLLLSGGRSLFAWLASFRHDIAVTHGAAGMLAHGTRAMEPGPMARIARAVARQWSYARHFAAQVGSGVLLLGKGAVARAAMYADAAWATFMNAQIEVAKLAGKTQARRILGFAESHCHDSTSKRTGQTRPGCVELARMGWVPIGEIVPIGQATCLSACHCRVDTKY